VLIDDRGQLRDFALGVFDQLRGIAVGLSSGKRSVQSQRCDPVGISGGAQHAHRAAFRHAEQGATLGTRRVEHRVEVLHALLECGQAGDRVG
jgi:hypothetical protein